MMPPGGPGGDGERAVPASVRSHYHVARLRGRDGTHRGAAIVNEPGSLCWADLATRDQERSRRFYGELFGRRPVPMDGGGPEYNVWYPAGAGEKLGGTSVMAPFDPRSGAPP